MDGAILLSTTGHCRDFLRAHLTADWARQGDLVELSTTQLVSHVAETLLWYASDLMAGDTELSAIQFTIEGDPHELVRALDTHARMLALLVDAVPADTRGFHPHGISDPSGFAAMGCDELLVHTSDAAAALGVDFTPPGELAAAVLARLFPWAPDGFDPWQTLLWANGRTALPGHPKLDRWRWHCAPLDEWDGTRP